MSLKELYEQYKANPTIENELNLFQFFNGERRKLINNHTNIVSSVERNSFIKNTVVMETKAKEYVEKLIEKERREDK